MRDVCKILCENLKERDHMRDLYVGGRMMLKCALHEQCVLLHCGLD